MNGVQMRGAQMIGAQMRGAHIAFLPEWQDQWMDHTDSQMIEVRNTGPFLS